MNGCSLNENLSLGRLDIIGGLGLTFCRLQIRQFWITDLASFFPLVIQNFSLLNDKICSLPLRKFFQCKSNKNNLDAIYFPLRMIECLKSNGSSARGICPPIIIMLSCNSSFKDNILQFDGTVYVVLSEQY